MPIPVVNIKAITMLDVFGYRYSPDSSCIRALNIEILKPIIC